jgi:hypothetical protein
MGDPCMRKVLSRREHISRMTATIVFSSGNIRQQTLELKLDGAQQNLDHAVAWDPAAAQLEVTRPIASAHILVVPRCTFSVDFSTQDSLSIRWLMPQEQEQDYEDMYLALRL